MPLNNPCQEKIGLFIIQNCISEAIANCAKCSKAICKEHTFASKNSTSGNLCLSCFSDEDTRLTKDLELFSTDRYVWRKKMIQRFHTEYHFLPFMASDYGYLFSSYTSDPFYGSGDDDTSFDS